MSVSMAEITAEVTADLSGFDSGMASAGQSVDNLATKGQSAGSSWQASSLAMAGASATITAGILSSIGAAGDFQSSMNQIGAVTGATADQLNALSAVAMDVGAKTAFSAQEGADAIAELAKAGVGVPDILNGAAMATANLAAAAGVDMPRAAEVMSSSMNMFKISGDQATQVADMLAGASNASSASIDSLAMGLSQAGPSAAGLGLSLQETVAQLALFSNYGLQGSDAGTSMKTMLASLTPSTKAAKEEFAALGLSTADTANAFFDAQGHFVGMEQATNLLYTALAGLTDEQRMAAEETIFGSDASRAAEITFQAQKAAVEGTADGYSTLLGQVAPAGQATAVANAQMAGMNGALDTLGGSLDTASTAFGNAFLPAATSAAGILTTLVNVFTELPAPVQTAIAAASALAAGLLALGAAIAPLMAGWGALTTAISPIAGLLGGVTAEAGLAGAALAVLTSPITLIVAALAALYIAYQTNFLGFADGVNAAAALLSTALGNLVALAQAVATAFQSGGIGAALSVLSTAFTTAWANIQTAISSIDWAAVSTTIQTTLQDISDNILAAFNDINWTDVGTKLLDGVKLAVGLIVGLDTLLVEKGTDLLTGFLSGAQDFWNNTAGPWLLHLPQDVFDGLGVLSGVLLEKGKDLLQGILQGAADKWPEIEAWFKALVDPTNGTIVGALGVLTATLLQKGKDLLDGLRSGAQDVWNNVLGPWLEAFPQSAIDAVGELGETLKASGTALLDGLRLGALDVWNNVLGPWLQALPGELVKAVGNLGTTLFGAGQALIQGLINGIGSMKDALTGAVGGAVGGAVDDAKNTLGIHSPSTVFHQIGVDSVQGFIDGIHEQTPAAADAAGQLATAAVTKLRDVIRQIRGVGNDAAQSFWQGMLDQTPKTIEAAQFIAEQALAAATNPVERAQARAGGTQLMIETLTNQLQGLNEASAEYAAIQAQIASLTATFQQQQIDLANVQERTASQHIKDLQRELAATQNAQKRDELKAQIADYQQQLGLLDQLEAAWVDMGSATSDAAKEIAQIKIDAITAQLAALQDLDVGSLFPDQPDNGLTSPPPTTDEPADPTGKRGHHRRRHHNDAVTASVAQSAASTGVGSTRLATSGAQTVTYNVTLEHVELPGVHNAQEFIDAIAHMMNSRDVSKGRHVG